MEGRVSVRAAPQLPTVCFKTTGKERSYQPLSGDCKVVSGYLPKRIQQVNMGHPSVEILRTRERESRHQSQRHPSKFYARVNMKIARFAQEMAAF